MADPSSLNGNDVAIYLRTGVGPDVYKVIVCATDSNLTTTKEVIESITKCGRSVKPGTFKWDMDFSGEVDIAPDSTEQSLNELWTLYVAGTKSNFGFQNGAGDWGFQGDGYMTKCDISAPVNGIVTFSISVTGTSGLTVL